MPYRLDTGAGAAAAAAAAAAVVLESLRYGRMVLSVVGVALDRLERKLRHCRQCNGWTSAWAREQIGVGGGSEL